MAKVQGPLFSVEAKGSYAGALVFAKWKGRQYVRQLVIPTNPKSSAQQTARNKLRLTAAIQSQINGSFRVRQGQTLRDKSLLTTAAPSGQAWNGAITKSLIGKGALDYFADDAAWNALTPVQREGWNSNARLLVPPYGLLPQASAGGEFTTPLSEGQQFFHAIAGMSRLGVGAAPGVEPPIYA